MPLFVDKQRVPVYERDDLTSTDPAQNVVYIKSRMNWKETSTYKDVLFTMETSGLQPHIGAAETAAMTINVVGWDGPGFCDERGVRCPARPSRSSRWIPPSRSGRRCSARSTRATGHVRRRRLTQKRRSPLLAMGPSTRW
jgi:hypothetical protein